MPVIPRGNGGPGSGSTGIPVVGALADPAGGRTLAAMINIHHLELFYYVARFGGITRAAERMPYGIQQPAISKQLLEFEESLRARLFERQPFKLTAIGEEIYDHARPFFEDVETMSDRVRSQLTPFLRMAASELVLREYLPPVIKVMKRAEPGLQFALRAGSQRQIETWLRDGHVDIGIAALDDRPPTGLASMTLLDVAPVLLVPRDSEIQSAAYFWSQKRIREPLVFPAYAESLRRVFQRGLKEMGITWPTIVETSSTALVAWYVANGDGIGVAVDHPILTHHPSIRPVPLPGFEPVSMGALWRPPVGRLTKRMLAAIRQEAAKLRAEDRSQANGGRRRGARP